MFKKRDFVVNGIITFVRNYTETITLPCKVDIITLEVFNFDIDKVFNGLRILNSEQLIINGVIENVRGTSDELKEDFDFWYNDM